MIKVVIVDDDAFIREGLRIVLGADSEITIVDCFENGEACLEFLKGNKIDIILLDMRMPILNGVETLKRLNKSQKTLVLTTFDEDDLIEDAIKFGANGYILKNSPPNKIISAIKSTFHGNNVFDNNVAQKITMPKSIDSIEKFSKYNLTDREMDIVRLISNGLSNKEIAGEIYISEGTVKNYISSILSKMNLKHRTQIAIEYLR